MMGGMDDDEGSMKLRRMIYICDSTPLRLLSSAASTLTRGLVGIGMTVKELDSDGRVFTEQPTRMVRIARGSGTSVREVEELLSQHKMMANSKFPNRSSCQ